MIVPRHTHSSMDANVCVRVDHAIVYGVAAVSRIDKIIGLVCKRALYKRRYSAKETYNFIDPTDRSNSIRRSWTRMYGSGRGEDERIC